MEKNEQLPEDDERRKFKYRVAVLGNQVKNQDMGTALFHDLGNTPATFEASRWADFLRCLDGWEVQLADAVQAYIQALLRGPPFWVEIPREAWPEDGSWNKFRRPVVRLIKALYGHPDAGTLWEEHCDKNVKAVGFEPVGADVHRKMKLLLVVYVDDFKMAGPKENLKQGWNLLRTHLGIEPETPLGLYLGRNQIKGTKKLYGGKVVNSVAYDMEEYLSMSVQK